MTTKVCTYDLIGDGADHLGEELLRYGSSKNMAFVDERKAQIETRGSKGVEAIFIADISNDLGEILAGTVCSHGALREAKCQGERYLRGSVLRDAVWFSLVVLGCSDAATSLQAIEGIAVIVAKHDGVEVYEA
ncbi:MAG TPA: hypothetical protein VF829_03635 [Candidatus Paceibacterota bacterium]